MGGREHRRHDRHAGLPLHRRPPRPALLPLHGYAGRPRAARTPPLFAGRSPMGARGDVILQLDWTIGEVMRTLDSLGLADNTLLIFTSDNGPVIDDGYADRAQELLGDHRPMGIYRGGKYSLYEAGTRIPFIVRWPEGVAPGEQPALFSQIDVYASLAALLGRALPEGPHPTAATGWRSFWAVRRRIAPTSCSRIWTTPSR